MISNSLKFDVGDVIKRKHEHDDHYKSRDDSLSLIILRKILKRKTRKSPWGFIAHYKLRFFNYDQNAFEDDWVAAFLIDDHYVIAEGVVDFNVVDADKTIRIKGNEVARLDDEDVVIS